MKRVFLIGWVTLALAAALTVEPVRASPPQPRVRILSQTPHEKKSFSDEIENLTPLSWVFIIVVPLFAWPAFRGWLHVLSGNYEAAIHIYEKRLARQPSHLRLYLTLANLYLLAGRRDQRAVTAYAMMRLLHFASSNVEKGIPSIATE